MNCTNVVATARSFTPSLRFDNPLQSVLSPRKTYFSTREEDFFCARFIGKYSAIRKEFTWAMNGSSCTLEQAFLRNWRDQSRSWKLIASHVERFGWFNLLAGKSPIERRLYARSRFVREFSFILRSLANFQSIDVEPSGFPRYRERVDELRKLFEEQLTFSFSNHENPNF